jgi:uncharacterized protein (TIGR00369 family)
MYSEAPCNKYYTPNLTVSKGKADVVIPIKENLFHAAGAAHGSVYFKAIDDAAFFAVNSLVEDVFVLTVNLNVYLIRPISHGEMRAVGQVVFSSRNLFVADARITDSKGREVGRGSGMFTRSKIKLNPEIGYK